NADKQQPRETSRLHRQPTFRVAYFHADVKATSTRRIRAKSLGRFACDPISRKRVRAGAAQVIQTTRQVRLKRMLIEILVRIAHVRVFRLVPHLRRKFRVAGMNVRNIWRQNGVIAFPPDWKRKRQNFDKTGYVACARAPQSAPNTIASPGGITFRLVDLVNRHKELGRSDDKIRNTATKFARWAIIVRRRVLNIGEGSAGKTSNGCEGKDRFHRHSKPVKCFRTAKAILYFWFSVATLFCVFNIEIAIVTARMSTMTPSERALGSGK